MWLQLLTSSMFRSMSPIALQDFTRTSAKHFPENCSLTHVMRYVKCLLLRPDRWCNVGHRKCAFWGHVFMLTLCTDHLSYDLEKVQNIIKIMLFKHEKVWTKDSETVQHWIKVHFTTERKCQEHAFSTGYFRFDPITKNLNGWNWNLVIV